LIANAAHQLRNPISAVQAQAEAALAARSEKEMQRRLSKTVSEAKHASHLAEQLLLLEKLSLASELQASQKVDLNKTVLVSTTRLADRILDRGIEFSFDPWRGEIFVDGDPVLIQEIITNLIENAVKHGGSTLSKISVSVLPDKGHALLLVEDDGKGISEENRALVFERFAQVDHGPGSGLGLAVVAEITRCHGGAVSVELTKSGQGVRFKVVLPLFE
jgi:two-component system sensor histidine kinase TctE